MAANPDIESRWNGMVAGIGASAGGVPALRAFFEALPEETDLAFVVILHSQPNRLSRLPELLRACTRLPVCEAAEGLAPRGNHVYVAHPGQALTLSEGIFRTQPFSSGVTRPGIDTIDCFLESLAADRGERAIAVVLSGMGTDGAIGALRVKQHGGVVFVQNPLTAQYDSMPLAAIGTGAADHVLPVAHIAQQIIACGSADYAPPARSVQLTQTTNALDAILTLVRDKAGFDLSGYKLRPIIWSIERRLRGHGLKEFAEYARLLQQDPAEIGFLVRDIPIHVTRFFRDPSAWSFLETHVIDRLFRDRGPADAVRAWSAACASGEEAYSLAMLLLERASREQPPKDFRVFATDASPQIVAHAGRGLFPVRAVTDLSAERQARFFDLCGDAQQVRKELREKIVFAPQHLLTDPPLRGLDLVVCRNLLIYLDREAIRRVVFLLHAALRTGGYLFLGASELVPPDYSGFENVSSNYHIFRKVGPIVNAKVSFPRRLDPLRAAQAAATAGALIHADSHPDAPSASEALRISHEELDASHEELEAVNEELRSTNEQLNLTNEELNAANARLVGKIDELQTQTSVLSSAGIMTLFLDEELRVRWFTTAVSALFPLMPADIGRRITDLSPKFHDPNFIEGVLNVMRTDTLIESEVHGNAGEWYTRRIQPFHGGDTRKGVAVTFSDITERKNAQDALHEAQAQLKADLAGMRSLYELHSKLASETNLDVALGEVLAVAVEFTRTDRGTLQLLGMDKEQKDLVAHLGFDEGTKFSEQFLDPGAAVVSGIVRRTRQRLVIEDLATFPALSGTKDREAALACGVRATLSTPMITRDGELLGVLSTQFREPHRPGEHELRMTDLLTWTAVHFVERHYNIERALKVSHERMQRALEAPTARNRR